MVKRQNVFGLTERRASGTRPCELTKVTEYAQIFTYTHARSGVLSRHSEALQINYHTLRQGDRMKAGFKVVIFGATGQTGKACVEAALREGLYITIDANLVQYLLGHPRA